MGRTDWLCMVGATPSRAIVGEWMHHAKGSTAWPFLHTVRARDNAPVVEDSHRSPPHVVQSSAHFGKPDLAWVDEHDREPWDVLLPENVSK